MRVAKTRLQAQAPQQAQAGLVGRGENLKFRHAQEGLKIRSDAPTILYESIGQYHHARGRCVPFLSASRMALLRQRCKVLGSTVCDALYPSWECDTPCGKVQVACHTSAFMGGGIYACVRWFVFLDQRHVFSTDSYGAALRYTYLKLSHQTA